MKVVIEKEDYITRMGEVLSVLDPGAIALVSCGFVLLIMFSIVNYRQKTKTLVPRSDPKKID